MKTIQKKCKIVMLPVTKHNYPKENEFTICDNHLNDFTCGLRGPDKYLRLTRADTPLIDIITSTYRHLYITSDDEIKEGDWFIGSENQLIHASRDVYDDLFSILQDANYSNAWKSKGKVVATTDKSLNLPQPSKAFIEKYCKLGGIDEVMVEYDIVEKGLKIVDFSKTPPEDVVDIPIQPVYDKPKVNSHNEITINPIKDSWNREEVESILFKYASEEWGVNTSHQDIKQFNNWIKENL